MVFLMDFKWWEVVILSDGHTRSLYCLRELIFGKCLGTEILLRETVEVNLRSVSDLSRFEHLGGAQLCLFFQPTKRVLLDSNSVTRARDQAPMHSFMKAVSLMSSYFLNFNPQRDGKYREDDETYF